jgi:VRR-NUC domain.
MTRLNAKQAKELGIDLELGKICKKKKDQGIYVFQKQLTEAEVLDQVKKYLQATGWLVMRIHQSLGSHRGLPDLICLKDGKTIYVETKSQHPRAKLSRPQEIMRQEIEQHGGLYVVAQCVEDVEEAIKSVG